MGWILHHASTKRNFCNLKKRDVVSLITNFWAPMQKNRLWSHAIPVEIIKQSPSESIVKMPECLEAKTFHEAGVADIGYAATCHADIAVTDAFNLEIILIRNKCFMKGDDCCLFEYTLDS